MAIEGVKDPRNCKFTMVVSEVVLLDVVEYHRCTAEAEASIRGVPSIDDNEVQRITSRWRINEGDRFGKLIAISRVINENKRTAWVCLCECGRHVAVEVRNLLSGHSVSCGCTRLKNFVNRVTKHGLANKHRLYSIWKGMRQRCGNPNHTDYQYYGGRGITVDARWNDFGVFYEWAMTNGYNDRLTIERLDVHKGYAPENCEWATWKKQAVNRTTTHSEIAKKRTRKAGMFA